MMEGVSKVNAFALCAFVCAMELRSFEYKLIKLKICRVKIIESCKYGACVVVFCAP